MDNNVNEQNLQEYPKAALGKRILAYIIDVLIGGLPVGIFMIIGLGSIMGQTLSGGTPNVGSLGFLIVFIILGGLWALFYSLCRDGFGSGQSWGKKATGLMVVNLENNSPCTIGRSALRNVFQILISIVLSWIPALNIISGFAEPIVAVVHQKGHRVGDMVAKTQVIETEIYSSAFSSVAASAGSYNYAPPRSPGERQQPQMPGSSAGQSFSIGRSPSNNIVIDDPDVSRSHARIDFDGVGFSVTDLESTQGTYLNGQKVSGTVPLPPSSNLQIASVQLHFDGASIMDSSGRVLASLN